jgi:hypothetical protein
MRLLAIALLFAALPALAIEPRGARTSPAQAEPNGGRGRQSKLDLDAEPNGGKGIFALPALEDLVLGAESGDGSEPNGGRGRKLESSLEGYFNSISISQITEVGQEKVAELLATRYPVRAILADIRAKGVYADLDCRSETGSQLEVSTRFGAKGGDICLNLPVIADRLRGKSLEEGLIRAAALALEGHLRHFQIDPYDVAGLSVLQIADIDRKNRDEISLLVSYFIETARMTEYPILKWEARSNGLAAEF